MNARKNLNKTLEIILRWHRARQSRGSRAHVNKGKPAGTKRPAVKGMSRGLSERKQLIEPACPAIKTVYSIHIEIQLF